MKSNKLNLVLDFNNIAFRALFTCTYASEYEVSTFDTDKECDILIRKIAMDMTYVMRIFTPDRVIIACDSKHPWRNSVYDSIEGETYKGNRVKDESKNWTKIFTALDDYKQILREKGFVVSEIDNAEADDLAALWKENIFANGESVIFVSSDKDWSQLIEYRKDSEQFCISFNPISNGKGKKKLYVSEDFDSWLNTEENNNDIFFSSFNIVKKKVKDAQLKDNKIELEITDPAGILLEKIVCGDDGDNVPGFYEFFKNGKKWRMTPLRMQKAFETANVSTLNELKESVNINAFVKGIESVAKHTIDDINPEERLMRQRILVELNPVLFPSEISHAFDNHLRDMIDIGYFNTANIKMEDVLSGTRYVSKDFKKAKENSIFKELQNLDHLIERNTSLF